jgi:hypothetical protein
MSDKENNKAINKENKKMEPGRPQGKLNNSKNPPKFENFNGVPIE